MRLELEFSGRVLAGVSSHLNPLERIAPICSSALVRFTFPKAGPTALFSAWSVASTLALAPLAASFHFVQIVSSFVSLTRAGLPGVWSAENTYRNQLGYQLKICFLGFEGWTQ